MSNSRVPTFLWSIGCLLVFASARLVAQTTQWNGFASTDLALASNWSNGVHDSTKCALICARPGLPRLAINGVCRDLQVLAGGGLTVDARLDVHGSVTAAADVGGNGVLRMTGTVPTGSVLAVACRLAAI